MIRHGVVSFVILAFFAIVPVGAEEHEGLLALREAGQTQLSVADEAPFHSTANRVVDERLIELPGSGTRLALWDEIDTLGATTPWYSIGSAGGPMNEGKSTSYQLKVLHGEFDPLVRVPQVEEALAASTDTNLYLVQYVTQSLEEYGQTIEQLGGSVVGFMAHHANVVRMSPQVRSEVDALSFVRWTGPFHPAYRIESFLRDLRQLNTESFPTQRYNILVYDAGAAGKPVVAAKIEKMGGVVESADSGKFLLDATLTAEQLFQVIRFDEVEYVDRWSPLETDMDIVREIAGANYLETVAGYTGVGVRAEIFDSGFNVNHPDFASRPLLQHGGTVGNASHGTATCGINFGDGTGDARARGLMPDGQGIVADYNNIGLTGGTRYTHTGELKDSPYFAVFQTSSVGSARTAEYTTISADHDTLLFDWDVLHCQSQSNSGTTQSRPQAWAKNIVSGGAFNHQDTLTRADDAWAGTASIGPASDGRIKPDLSFFYDATYTTYSTGSGYGEFGGTSGATPSICGYFGLFFEMWSDGIFGNEVTPGATVFENRPHMTTAKAMLINTATQYDFVGQSHDLTRVHQGWGMPDIRTLYDQRNNISAIDESVLLANLETVEFNASVDPGEPALRVTMTYADPAGTPSSSQHRINDLTLKVTSPSGTVYWGNNGLKDGNWSVSGGAADTKDTVENVFVENPESGGWIVEVTASEINEDGHVETPELDADFALVVSGAFLATCTSDGTVSLTRASYACEDEATLRVVDCDLNTDDNTIQTVSVTVDSTTEPGGETVLLTETGPASATFTNTITLSESDAAGVLHVADGDTVTAEYIDADDGLGGVNVVKTDQANVDCSAPLITNVMTSNIEARVATVNFDTDEPAEGSVRYGASCAALTQTASRSGFVTTHAINLTGLQPDSLYFYAVDASDMAGNMASNDNGGACYSFTTPSVPEFYTELYGSDNDTDFLRFTFTPDGSADFYDGCTETIASFPSDPTGGNSLTISDDSFATVNLTGGTTLLHYGVSYSTFYVGSNGYVTFDAGDSDQTESTADHFSQPRISALFDDLNPATGGTVSWKQFADRIAVTFQGVPEYNVTNSNDFQIEMFFDGRIAISLLEIDATDGLAGISQGNGQSPDFSETDLSLMTACGGETCFDGVLNQGETRIDCGGPCPACACLDDAACADSIVCNGTEVCDAFGECQAGTPTCGARVCDETTDRCIDCQSNADCDDGLFCNGSEICLANNSCQLGADPCPGGNCDEAGNACITCNNDGVCDPGEDCGNCTADCISGSNPVCGNGVCEAADGEDCLSCPDDCNGVQKGKPADRFCCSDGTVGENPTTCVDARCSTGGNTCASSPVLAFCCGDDVCEDVETVGNCAADCTLPVPDEAGHVNDMMVITGFDDVSGTMSIQFGVPCSAADHTIEYSELTRANLETYNWIGQECSLGTSGTYDWATSGTPNAMFFVVVPHNGISEGSYGRSTYGSERSEDSLSTSCPMSQDLVYVCQ
jgi:hypothetical protein